MIEGQEGVSWEQWLALARACEINGFDGLFSSDHYLSLYKPASRGSLDTWTALAAIATHTEHIRLGSLVTPASMHHPGALAKVAASVDRMSGGRVELGLGAGWNESEHLAFGFPFPAVRERFDMLEEQLEIIRGLHREDDFRYQSANYVIEHGDCLPKPLQSPLPILIGGAGGPRMASLAARFANEFNSDGGTPQQCRERFNRVRAACEGVGRDPASITMSVMVTCVIGETDRDFRERVRRTAALMGISADELVRKRGAGWVFGTPRQATETIGALAEAGAQRIMLQHHLADDLDTPALLAREVLPTFVHRAPSSAPLGICRSL